jgi:hypothetical protein
MQSLTTHSQSGHLLRRVDIDLIFIPVAQRRRILAGEEFERANRRIRVDDFARKRRFPSENTVTSQMIVREYRID